MICCAYGACSQTLCHSCMYAYMYVETVFAVVQFKDLFHGLNMYAVQNKNTVSATFNKTLIDINLS